MDAIGFHSKISKKFDNHYNFSSLFRERFTIWTFLLNKYLKKDDIILDAGCGNGVLSFYIGELGNRVVAFDGSDKMVDLCNKKKILHHINCDITFLVEKLPLNDYSLKQKYNVIISSSVLEYVSDYNGCINNFWERLTQNGLLILSMPNRQSVYRKLERFTYSILKRPAYLCYVKTMFTLNEFISIMSANGFEVVENRQYSSKSFINNFLKMFLPEKYTNSLFVAVCRKINKV